nr:CHAD domain-containing protein [Halopseudomonas xiamenensis]
MFLDSYVTEIRSLETALLKAHERLAVEADDEALHDLRIAVRRIRSLIARSAHCRKTKPCAKRRPRWVG